MHPSVLMEGGGVQRAFAGARRRRAGLWDERGETIEAIERPVKRTRLAGTSPFGVPSQR
jgi:hypothetical protein